MDIQLSDREKIPEKSILGMMKHFIEAVNDMDSTVMIPSRLLDMKLEDTQMDTENGNKSLVPKGVDSRDLHLYYSLLKTVKRDLVKGTLTQNGETDDSMSSEEEDTDQNEQARQAANLFREHLRGLFSVLEQLTEMAKFLTSKYQQETGDYQTCPKPKSFIM
ncbi:mid1-interacting protein 1-like [Ptychodera flava]|uniref:mid1-interacting protein 1-like n=1 Tax=Ptychodera flava TaxID=63121 RepID=UPI00396A418F